MSHPILTALNKHRTKARKRRYRETLVSANDAAGTGRTPKEDLALPKNNIEETYATFHKQPYYALGSERDEQDGRNPGVVKPVILPKIDKDNYPDYQPGPVKIYTREEIEQYERERLNDKVGR